MHLDCERFRSGSGCLPWVMLGSTSLLQEAAIMATKLWVARFPSIIISLEFSVIFQNNSQVETLHGRDWRRSRCHQPPETKALESHFSKCSPRYQSINQSRTCSSQNKKASVSTLQGEDALQARVCSGGENWYPHPSQPIKCIRTSIGSGGW